MAEKDLMVYVSRDEEVLGQKEQSGGTQERKAESWTSTTSNHAEADPGRDKAGWNSWPCRVRAGVRDYAKKPSRTSAVLLHGLRVIKHSGSAHQGQQEWV